MHSSSKDGRGESYDFGQWEAWGSKWFLFRLQLLPWVSSPGFTHHSSLCGWCLSSGFAIKRASRRQRWQCHLYLEVRAAPASCLSCKEPLSNFPWKPMCTAQGSKTALVGVGWGSPLTAPTSLPLRCWFSSTQFENLEMQPSLPSFHKWPVPA